MKLFQKIALSIALLATFKAQAQFDPPPAAFFTVSPGPKICLGDVLQITDGSSGTLVGDVSYQYGDGTASSPPDPNPTHTYTSLSPILGFQLTQILPVTGGSVGFLTYTIPIFVVPATPLTATYKLCANGEVRIYIADTRFDSYDIDFGDGSAVVNAPRDPSGTTTSIHIYSGTAPSNVSIKGKFTAGNYCANSDVLLSVTPITTVPKPDVTFLETTLEDQNAGTLTVNFINTSSFDYRLDFKRQGFGYSPIDTVPSTSGMTSFTFDRNNTNPYNPTTQAALHASYVLNTKQIAYCVKVSSLSACGSSTLYDEICSITKFTTTVADLENDLTWEAYSGPNINNIEVERNNTTLTTLAGTSTAYNDNNNITCATQYCYQLKGILTTTSSLGAQYSLGARKCVTATSLTPRPALTNVNSTIHGSDVTVTFDAVGGGFTAKSYTLEESVNGGSYNNAASNNGSATSFTLHNRNTTANTYCYRVTYVDLCDLSPANGTAVTTCPIKLTVNLAEDGTVALSWTTYSGSSAVGTYTIEVRDDNGTVIRVIPGGSSNTATDLLSSSNGGLHYIVTTDIGTTSELVELQLSPTVYIPDAFSPNGDGINDFFELKGRFIQSVEVSIFNRWGEPVFHSTDPKVEWDGKVNGSDAMVGTYAYVIDVTGHKGETIKKRGTISLVR